MPNPTGDLSLDSEQLEVAKSHLNAIVTLTRAMAQEREGDVLALLALLRTLEACHKEIRDGLFQEAFPTNRQRLYSLLRDIESNGGWPYIPRMKLHQLLQYLESLPEQDEPSQ
ncbi:MAG: hypothetical protein ACFB4J_05485 [Elainellaceae cyanobacterium]